ncbi:hypothetical protein GH714_043520 [Hevea brasiliensis]|uniref:Uncharacterized protein n=1 Tax=Hevea brasiliensis TaxID=3981 RepID=A0A6A6K311_HEVBR|nr:hypothetical protein GH714_043520 [Hevea brasiliensis]
MIAMEELPQSQPLWEIHMIKYPTSEAEGNAIFKLHHSLGDGFSLMGALLSCLQRADNPAMPLTFPSVQLHNNKLEGKRNSICRSLLSFFSWGLHTISDFGSSIIKSSLYEDDKSPIRSGHPAVECLPVSVVTLSFSLHHIKQIRTKLGVTINDVITGTIFLATRLYMETVKQGSGKARTTSLVLLNTRMFGGYKSVQEMVKPDAEESHPKKESSFAVFLTAKYLQLVRKFRGPEAVSKHLHGTLKNTSLGITNVIGPMEQMALANHPVKGLYFVVTESDDRVLSYMGKLRVAALVEKDFIDPQNFKFHMQNAFDMIFKAAFGASPSPAN